MPSLRSLLAAIHFKRTGGQYYLEDELVDGATRGASSLQLGQLALFPVEKYTPGGVALSSANMAQSIRNAIAAAQDETGGIVMIPPGQWEMAITGDDIEVPGAGRNKPVAIQGGGMDITRLVYPTGYEGTAFKFYGSALTDFFFNGGLSDLTITCDSEDLSNTGIGLHIEGTVNMQFQNVTIRNFTGGDGMKATRGDPDYTNQYTQFYNFTVAGCDVNYRWRSVVNAQAYGLYSTAARTRDFIADDVKCSVYGGNMQSSPAVCVELTGEGGCRFVMHDYYWEGINPTMTMFKCVTPSVTYNVLELHGFHLGGEPQIFLDADAFSSVVLDNIYLIGNADTYVKGRNGAQVLMINSGDPVSEPSKFDLDAATASKLLCLNASNNQYTGGRFRSGIAMSLPSFADGAEPASPEAGDTHRDSTYDRPKVRTASAWRRLAYTTDDFDLTAELTPYAAAIWDPGLKRLRSVISGELDSLTGLISGNVLSAPGSGQRPTWNIADDHFGGHPSFSCAFTGDRFLAGTLGTPLPVGAHEGLLVVFRANVAGTDANRRIPIALEHAVSHAGSIVGYGDLNVNTRPYAYVGVTSPLQGPASLDTYGHVMFAQGDATADYLLIDSASEITGPASPSGLATARALVHLGGCWNTSVFVGCDVTIAYAAILNAPVPSEVRAKIMRLAMSKFGLR